MALALEAQTWLGARCSDLGCAAAHLATAVALYCTCRSRPWTLLCMVTCVVMCEGMDLIGYPSMIAACGCGIAWAIVALHTEDLYHIQMHRARFTTLVIFSFTCEAYVWTYGNLTPIVELILISHTIVAVVGFLRGWRSTAHTNLLKAQAEVARLEQQIQNERYLVQYAQAHKLIKEVDLFHERQL